MGKVWRVSGPLVIAEGMLGSQVYEIVEIGDEGIVGEIIGLEEDKAIIQAHEDTIGLKVGEKVKATGAILTVELGPGVVGSIYDGLQKSLTDLMEGGAFLKRGAKAFALPRDKKWQFTPTVKAGDKVNSGDIIGTVPETHLIEHRIMVPIGIEGVIKFVTECVEKAWANPCPPIVVGVGLGGNFEKAALMAKHSLLRPLGSPNPDPELNALERQMLDCINALGIGPQGLGGTTTALDVHIEAHPCHIASLPVAVNIECHSHRHIEEIL